MIFFKHLPILPQYVHQTCRRHRNIPFSTFHILISPSHPPETSKFDALL